MADNQMSKSKRDMMLERMRGKYPDKSFEDEEEIYGQIYDDYDDYDRQLGDRDNELKGFRENSEKLVGLFDRDPKFARFITDGIAGKDPLVSLIEIYGEDFTSALEAEDKRELLAKSNKERMERLANEKELEAMYNDNLKISLEKLESMCQQEGIEEERVDSAIKWLSGVVNDYIVGKIDPVTVRMALKAEDFDSAVAAASEEGEVRGRNFKIEEKLQKRSSDDGIPSIGGQNGIDKSQAKKRRSIFDIANEA